MREIEPPKQVTKPEEPKKVEPPVQAAKPEEPKKVDLNEIMLQEENHNALWEEFRQFVTQLEEEQPQIFEFSSTFRHNAKMYADLASYELGVEVLIEDQSDDQGDVLWTVTRTATEFVKAVIRFGYGCDFYGQLMEMCQGIEQTTDVIVYFSQKIQEDLQKMVTEIGGELGTPMSLEYGKFTKTTGFMTVIV